jgi:polysaccharide biosynthesis PFTS motif protein
VKQLHTLPNIFIFSIPFAATSNQSILKFMEAPRIQTHIQTKKNQILVSCKGVAFRKNTSEVTITRDIPLFLFRNHCDFRKKFALIKHSLRILVGIIFSRYPDVLLPAYKEIMFEQMLYGNFKFPRSAKFICTQSNLRVLPQVMYKGKQGITNNLMFWYSANNNLVYSKHEQMVNVSDNYLSLKYIDKHLVWNESEKLSLSKITAKSVFSVGSLLFYPQPDLTEILPHKKTGVNVLIFDIPPKSEGSDQQFINEQRAIATILDILNSTELLGQKYKIKLNVSIKSKKKHNLLDRSAYTKFLRHQRRSGRIEIKKDVTNLYQIISKADVVICFPWTSPALIAQELRIKVLYYIFDPAMEWDLDKIKNSIPLCRNSDQLIRVLDSFLG